MNRQVDGAEPAAVLEVEVSGDEFPEDGCGSDRSGNGSPLVRRWRHLLDRELVKRTTTLSGFLETGSDVSAEHGVLVLPEELSPLRRRHQFRGRTVSHVPEVALIRELRKLPDELVQ